MLYFRDLALVLLLHSLQQLEGPLDYGSGLPMTAPPFLLLLACDLRKEKDTCQPGLPVRRKLLYVRVCMCERERGT